MYKSPEYIELVVLRLPSSLLEHLWEVKSPTSYVARRGFEVRAKMPSRPFEPHDARAAERQIHSPSDLFFRDTLRFFVL